MQHFWHLLAEVQCDLYEGDAAAARGRLLARWPALDASMLCEVRLIRLEALELRARTALALAAERAGPERRRLLAEAERAARRVRRLPLPFAVAMAELRAAGARALRGDPERALASLDESARGFDASSMAVHAEAARHAAGSLRGGDAGRAACAEAERRLLARGVRNPTRMVALYAPGLIA